MWPFNRIGTTKRLNTIDIGDDLDDVEMLMAVEDAFDFKMTTEDGAKLKTIGDLYDLVKHKMPKDETVDPVWTLIEKIARDYSGSRDPIDQDTTFYAKFAKPRAPTG